MSSSTQPSTMPRPFDQEGPETEASTAAVLPFPPPPANSFAPKATQDPVKRAHEIFAELCLDVPKGGFTTDGRFHHFAPNRNHPKDKCMSYAVHLTGAPTLLINYFREGDPKKKLSVFPLSDGKLTEEQKAKFREEAKADRAKREKELTELQAKAAVEAERIYNEAAPARREHPYLLRKGIEPHGLRQFTGEVAKPDGERKTYTDVLVVPLWRNGKLLGLQFINANGDKWFLDGTQKQGAYYIIGEIEHSDKLNILEGFATAATVYEATGVPCAVAFDAYNLLPVAKALKLALPSVELTVGADDDWKRVNKSTGEVGNIGLVKATEAARAIGAKLVVPKFGTDRGEKDTDFNDLAKLYGLDTVRACFAPETEEEPAEEGAPEEGAPLGGDAEPVEQEKTPLPSNFGYAEDGSIKQVIGRTTKGEPIWAVLCSPIEFLARTEDVEGKHGGLILRIMNDSGKWHKLAITRSDLVAADDLLRLLMDHGLRIMTAGRDTNAFKLLLNWVIPERRARCVSNIGWSDNAFVFPDEVIGQPDDVEIIYQPASVGNHAYRTCGTFEEWKSGVAALARGNSRIQLALSTALAGPLLRLVPMEGGGIHLRGASSTGKTTSLQAAGSIWGGGGVKGFVDSWRVTDNGLEGLALMHNDTLLLLDELAQVDPRAAAQIAYMLANGKGKGRASRDGGARKISEWLTIFISTGEISLSTKMSEGGKHSTAGQEVRVLDIPADAGKGLGLLEELHGFKKPGALADALCDCARKNYGHAARAFLTELTKDVEGYTKEVRDTIDAVKERLCPPGADSQVGRAAARFALIAAAGELAIEFGVFPWPEGDAEKAAERCFNDWLRERGGPEQKEDKDAIERVIGFLRRESSRFRPWAMEFSPVPNCAGYSKDNPRRFYIYLTTFRDEICGKNGLDYRNAAKVLAEAGYLIKSSRSRYLRTERLPIEGNQEVYVIRLPQSTEEAEKEDGSTASYERQAE